MFESRERFIVESSLIVMIFFNVFCKDFFGAIESSSYVFNVILTKFIGRIILNSPFFDDFSSLKISRYSLWSFVFPLR